MPFRHRHILAQSILLKISTLQFHWQTLAVICTLLFSFAIITSTSSTLMLDRLPQITYARKISLPNTSYDRIRKPTPPFQQTEIVRHKDTWPTLCARLNIRNAEALHYLKSAALATQLRPGKPIFAKTSPSGELLELRYHPDASTVLLIKGSATGYHTQKIPATVHQRTVLKYGTISSSLFATTYDLDIPDSVTMQMVDIFGSEIDFHLDLRKGDQLSIVYEEKYDDYGHVLSSGQILAVEFVNRGKSFKALLNKGYSEKPVYFSPEGKSLNKAFLRSPLEFTRISSGFTLSRFHPLLNTWRAHRGVDYAAPTGTRVKATAAGTALFVGKHNGYGQVIELKHGGNISTLYGHLSGFAAGLRVGGRVSQGDVIGYVGMTGLATGPHLHYELRINGVHQDPTRVNLPQAIVLSLKEIKTFRQNTAPLLEQINLLKQYLVNK